MTNLTPPQAPATWTHTPEQLTKLIDETIAKDRALWDKIGSLPPEECTFESVRLTSKECLLSGYRTPFFSGLR